MEPRLVAEEPGTPSRRLISTGQDATRLGISLDLRSLTERPLHALRLLLVGDVLLRVTEELAGRSVRIAVMLTDPSLLDRLARLADPLHLTIPTTVCTTAQEVSELLGALATIALGPLQHSAGADTRPVLPIAPVQPLPAYRNLEGLLTDNDPLALRMAMLRAPRSSPVMLSTARLRRADETLYRWRFKVAGWRDTPPTPADQLDVLHKLLTDRLDTATVLRMMHQIERDHWVPSGTKYRIFTDLDRILRLDLTRRPLRPSVW